MASGSVIDVLAEIEGSEGLWWLSLLSPELLLAVLGALVVVLVIAAIVGLVHYGRARKDGRWSPLVLALKLETTPPGPRREILKLRLRLQRALYRARRAGAGSARGGTAGRRPGGAPRTS